MVCSYRSHVAHGQYKIKAVDNIYQNDSKHALGGWQTLINLSVIPSAYLFHIIEFLGLYHFEWLKMLNQR